jgi:hypothetical protein
MVVLVSSNYFTPIELLKYGTIPYKNQGQNNLSKVNTK